MQEVVEEVLNMVEVEVAGPAGIIGAVEVAADDTAEEVQVRPASPSETVAASPPRDDADGEEGEEEGEEEEEAAAPAASNEKSKYDRTCDKVKDMFQSGAFVHAIGKLISRNPAFCNKSKLMIQDKNPYTIVIGMLQARGVPAAAIRARLVADGKGGTAAMGKVKGP